MHYRLTGGRKVFVFFNYTFCIFVSLLCLLPIVHTLAISFSGKIAIMSGNVSIYPVDFTLDNYRYVIKDAQFFRAFIVSVKRVLLAVLIHMFLTAMAAYPISLSKQKFSARSFYVWFFMITLLFGGGLVPTYLVVFKTGLIDTIWSLVIPSAVPVFNVIILQNFMKTLPDELSESAAIDGAGHFRILFQIILPLCRASIATLLLFVAVNNWNAWFDGMLYINNNLKFPLQTYLRTIIVEVDMHQVSDINTLAKMVSSEGANTAKIFVAMVPILSVYPFLQKHFVKGIVIGSVKG